MPDEQITGMPDRHAPAHDLGAPSAELLSDTPDSPYRPPVGDVRSAKSAAFVVRSMRIAEQLGGGAPMVVCVTLAAAVLRRVAMSKIST
jgi:hypothetical protein